MDRRMLAHGDILEAHRASYLAEKYSDYMGENK